MRVQYHLPPLRHRSRLPTLPGAKDSALPVSPGNRAAPRRGPMMLMGLQPLSRQLFRAILPILLCSDTANTILRIPRIPDCTKNTLALGFVHTTRKTRL